MLDANSVFGALDVGIILLDRTRRIVVWNDWIASHVGAANADVIGKNFYEVFPALRDTRLQNAIDDSFASGNSSILTHSLNNAIFSLKGRGGENVMHDVIVRPVSAGPGQHCLLQVNDVTVAVMRDRVLRERQNARYHAIVETAPDAIITIDADWTIQWMNGIAEKTFGYSAAELLGEKIDVLLDKKEDIHALSLGRGSKIAGRQAAFQIMARRKDRTAGYFEVSNASWNSNERTFITTIWRDVTDRLAAEQALRESESRLRALLEALPQLVWTCAPDGDCDYVNPQWQIYIGGQASDYFGQGWLQIVHADDRPELESAWNEALSLKTVFDIEARLRRHDGTYRWFKLRSAPMRGTGSHLVRWFGTATDITDLIEARDALRSSNEELESRVAERTREHEAAIAQLFESQKMETIGQLTGGMAHDFNNLLAVILGSLALLKKALPDDPRTSRLLQGAVQGAERGATLTKRLLAFARRQELKLDIVKMQKLIPDVFDFLRQSVGPHITVEIDVAGDTRPVLIDSNQFELALMNMAVNARDAMPKGGKLTIVCRNETDEDGLPRTLPPGDYARVSISDTGEGMSETTRARAMDPFFTTKGVGKGTGLGLSMVQGMTAQTGGAMEIQSELGKGTTITLWLPQAGEDHIADMPAPAAARQNQQTDRKLRVLLVDDDPLVSLNTASLLMDLGHSVLEAHSALHALELLETDTAFDLVISDYAMPGMNGLDLALRIRENRREIPIILATGYAELPVSMPMEFPRLNKPYSQEDLRSALDRALPAPPS